MRGLCRWGSRLTAKVRGPAGMFGFRTRRLSVSDLVPVVYVKVLPWPPPPDRENELDSRTSASAARFCAARAARLRSRRCRSLERGGEASWSRSDSRPSCVSLRRTPHRGARTASRPRSVRAYSRSTCRSCTSTPRRNGRRCRSSASSALHVSSDKQPSDLGRGRPLEFQRVRSVAP